MINFSFNYGIPSNYVTKTSLNVRTGPSTNAAYQARENMTEDGRRHSDGHVLRPGTTVTVKRLIVDCETNMVWAEIPSGYICFINKDKKYFNPIKKGDKTK